MVALKSLPHVLPHVLIGGHHDLSGVRATVVGARGRILRSTDKNKERSRKEKEIEKDTSKGKKVEEKTQLLKST